MPALGLDWSERIVDLASSATAEVASITESLRALVTLPPRPSVILSDSKFAMQRISMPSLSDTSMHQARELAGGLISREQQVLPQ